MKFEQKPNAATVWVNVDKRPDETVKNPDGSSWVRKDADYKGSGNFNGLDCWVDVYRKISRKNEEYFSIKVKPKHQAAPIKKAPANSAVEKLSVPFEDDDLDF